MPLALPTETPFVLLDDARIHDAAVARLYRDPVEIIVTRQAADIPAALHALRTATDGGLHAAGFLGYESGHAISGSRIARTVPEGLPCLWFGLFRDYAEIAPADVAALLPDPAGAWAGTPRPAIDFPEYEARLGAVRQFIEAGDIYQANLTFPADVPVAGHPLALYAGLRARAKAGYGAVVHMGRAHGWLLSLSPELFFAQKGARLTARPMKGTATRHADPQADAAAAQALAADPKQRAENLIIVDLMRNDLSRVAEPGSVAVPRLFEVERYPTVHQMTSTVTATLARAHDAIDVLSALFPCGSITGAPKLRAMAIIDAVEGAARGAYTGSIGRIDAGGDSAAFNVAIRTLHLTEESATARMGLGSGIVADSECRSEWQECLAKGAFVASPRRFDLIETMAFEPHDGLLRLEAHLARMKASATALGFKFDRHGARNALQAATFPLRAPSRVRLLLSRSGAYAIETAPAPAAPDAPVDVALVRLPVPAADIRLRHKTSDRWFYDAARKEARTFEVLFTDGEGRLTEGSFTNIFVERAGVLLTPPLSHGLLGGVLRTELIETGCAIEANLRAEDLSGGFFLGNALRGLLPARLKTL